ncbi:MAG: hypothetical protein R3E01_17840 [Pirellulaceae bacterium]
MRRRSMRRWTEQTRFWWLVLLFFWGSGSVATVPERGAMAQSPPVVAPTDVERPGPAAVDPVPLTDKERGDRSLVPITKVRDKDGTLIQIPDITQEELDKAYRMLQQLEHPTRPPDYSLQRIELDGEVKGDRAALQVRFHIDVQSLATIAIPLRLNNAVMTEPAVIPDQVAGYITPDDDGGYTYWVTPTAKGTHDIQLRVSVPVAKTGEQSRVQLDVPRATISRLALRVPGGKAVARTSSDIPSLRQSRISDETSLITADGFSGRFDLSWSATEANDQATSALFEARGVVMARVRSASNATIDATFYLRNFGKPMNNVKIRLPRGCRLVQDRHPRYEIKLAEPESNANTGLVADVTFLQQPEPDEQFEIRLSTELAIESGDTNESFRPLAFEVIGALRHYGTVTLQADGDWLLKWQESPDVTRIATPPEQLSLSGVVATFSYQRQPAELSVWVTPKSSNVQVEPIYHIDLTADANNINAVLTANMKVDILGAGRWQLEADFTGWQVTGTYAEGLVKNDAIDRGQVSPLEIPFSQQVARQFNMQITARRTIERAQGSLELRLPFMLDAMPSSALVVLTIADNIDLAATHETLTMLAPENVPEELELPQYDERPPLCYRYHGDPQNFRLEYLYTILEQQVSVDVATTLTAAPDYIAVEQRFHYLVRHAAVPNVTLGLRRELAAILREDPTFELRLGAERLETLPTAPTQGPPGTGNELVAWPLYLRQATKGHFDVTLGYKIPVGTTYQLDSARNSIPLAVPLNTESVRNQLTIHAHPQVDVRAVDGTWSPRTLVDASSTSRDVAWSRLGESPQIEVAAQTVDEGSVHTSRVEQAYYQTWLTHTTRRDRAVFRITTSDDTLSFNLPATSSDRNNIHVFVDGHDAEGQWDIPSDGTLTLRLAPIERRTINVEIFQSHPHRPQRGRIAFDVPVVLGSTDIQQTYWQFVLPGDEHVIVPPADWATEDTWGWQRYYWGRRPRYSQRFLENWIDGTQQHSPSNSANEYLYSSYGMPTNVVLYTTSRRVIVFVGAASVLIAGLSFIYVPVLRHASVFLAVGVMLSAVAMLLPTAIIAAQLMGIGLLLLLVAQLLFWITSRPSVPVVRAGSTVTTASPSASGRARLATTDITPSSRESITIPALPLSDST